MPPQNSKASTNHSLDKLYSFGGINSNDISNSNLRVLDFDRQELQPCHWSTLKTSCVKPEPRHSPICQYDEFNNNLIVAGGFDNGRIFDDVWILQLKNLEWLKLTQSPPLTGRFSCSSLIVKNKLYIFGGIQDNGFSNSEIVQIEFREKSEIKQFIGYYKIGDNLFN